MEPKKKKSKRDMFQPKRPKQRKLVNNSDFIQAKKEQFRISLRKKKLNAIFKQNRKTF